MITTFVLAALVLGACGGPCQPPCPTPVCGDGECNGDETCETCPEDCGACAPVCGDGECNGDETCETCPEDCGACAPVCGDGECNGDETCETCPEDCGTCPTLTLNLGGGVTMDLIQIPAGTFQMGTNDTDDSWLEHSRPVHTVTISQPFYMGKYEVTQAQWRAVMGTEPWSGQSYTIDQDNAAGSYLSWDDAQAFCAAVQSQTGYAVRLPSEVEWEYACRAGTSTKYYFGDDESQLSNYAWWYGNAYNVGEGYAHAVGQLLPNDFGLYDMHGNVGEWCEDRWHDNYTGAPADGSAWTDGSSLSRVIRGGSWLNIVYFCCSASRSLGTPDSRYISYGFRLSLDSD